MWRDQKQVHLDVQRTHLTEKEQENVTKRVQAVLEPIPSLHYYQGYHDIALNCNSVHELRDLSLFHLRDFMAQTIDPTLAVLELVPQLLSKVDREIGDIIRDVHTPFALASIITLFSHDVNYENKDDKSPLIQQIIDHVRMQGLQFVLYLYAAIVVQNKDAIFKQIGEERDPEIVHSVLAKAGQAIDQLDFEKLLLRVESYQRKYPLRRLGAWRNISRHSALKSRSTTTLRAIKDLKSLNSFEVTKSRRSIASWPFAIAVIVIVLGVAMNGRRK